jgi:hypothetical protein
MGQDFWKASSVTVGTGVRAASASLTGLCTKLVPEALVYKTKAAEESKAAYPNVSFPKLRYIHLEGVGISATDTLVDMLLD